ncbi:MAG TPA: D-glycero-beta-D-manno-heptose 1-phosphate adenylyltransferase [Bryobacteraceae bacterium]|nr:D-glycero-beta-D-manno-heptose 1-phosphate adenylyltransferase [Bryobacteraceae bacterium]
MHNRAEILRQRAIWKQQGRRVVFTNGCYDLLHPGHIRLLEEAKSEGDILIVGLNTDASVARSKGAGRPVTNQCERAEMLLALAAVDAVVLFDEDTPRQLIAELLPDVLIKGADWTHFIAGKEEVEAAGGRVLTIALEPGHSTTAIIKKILSSQF